MLDWAFEHQQIIHNAPSAAGQAAIDDDTDMDTTLANGYLQNIWQRYLLGAENASNAVDEGYIMEHYMHHPPFGDPTHPTLREANDRVMYLATNW